MPELPEVQTVVNDLNKKIIKRRITGVWFNAPKIIKSPKPKELEKKIKGLVIEKIKRRGKNIFIYLGKNYLLLIHQKMTGHLLYGKWQVVKDRAIPLMSGPMQERVNDYIHIIFYLDNGFQLALSDLRKFAKILFNKQEDIENLSEIKNLGPDPLAKNFNFEKFKEIIGSQKGKIKQVLMNQEVIAGIGNIYSDEILWQVKIHPFKPANKLTAKELRGLYLSMQEILEKAVKLRGTSISDFRDTNGKSGGFGKVLRVYQQKDRPCSRCRTLIKRIKIGGRSAHFCSRCQVNNFK